MARHRDRVRAGTIGQGPKGALYGARAWRYPDRVRLRFSCRRVADVHLLREKLNLTGTHIGCDSRQCGARTVHIDGRAVNSCTVLIGQAAGSNISTIGDGELPRCSLLPQQSWPAMRLLYPKHDAIDIVHRHSDKLDEAVIRRELEGNICRYTGYHNIVKSVLDAAGRTTVSQVAE
jgi:aerobic carbon-monoxide dehydrogenase small subunit